MSKTLVEDGSDRKKFRVTLDNFEGHNLLSIRYWYRDKTSGELKPTKQGITITATNYLAFKSVISQHDEEVINHLNNNSDSAKKLAADKNANIDAAALVQEVTEMDLVVEPFQPPTEMFKVKYEGAFAKIIVNKRHSLSKFLDLENASPCTINLVSNLILALDLSLLSAGQAKNASGGIVLEMLKQELGLNITKYLKK